MPGIEEEEESLTGGAVCWEEERKGQTVRRRWVPWAKLLLKVFGSDVFQCSQCDGRMQRIAYTIRPKRSGGRIGPHRCMRWRGRSPEGRRPESFF